MHHGTSISIIIHPIADCSILQHSRVYVVAAKTSILADADTLQPSMISALQLIPHSWPRLHCYEHSQLAVEQEATFLERVSSEIEPMFSVSRVKDFSLKVEGFVAASTHCIGWESYPCESL